MAKAYALLDYDAGLLNRAEAEAVRDAGATLPATLAVAGAEPGVDTITVAGLAVGIVRFPALADPDRPVPADLAEATARAAAGLRGKVRLVVGLSGWGDRGEEAFLGAHPGAVDVLLGSGPGSGASALTAGGGKTLWSRTFIKGKTINRLDLLVLPEGPDFVWNPKTGYKAEVVSLDERFPADPQIAKLF